MEENSKNNNGNIKKQSDLSKKRMRIDIPIVDKKKMDWMKKRCQIRIEIEGKTFGRIRQLLRHRINPTGMVYFDGITLKRYKDRKEIIRHYIEKELGEYFITYTKERGLSSEPKPVIGFYDEQKACLDLIYDIFYDPIFQTVMSGLIAGFTQYLMDKIYNLLKSDKDKDNGPNITITNIIGNNNTVNT